jgi:dihydropteroate synthase
MLWRCRDRSFDLSGKTLVMGVLNLTPDSFSDGGRYLEPAAGLARARQLIAQGAEIVDLGPESTRPGADGVPAEEQLRRLLPVLEPLAEGGGVCLSVDTSNAAVAARALAAGAHVVNDVTALGDPGMARVVAAAGAGLVLMHMRGTPRTMQSDPRYEDAAAEVSGWLGDRLEAARRAGIEAERVALDPGIGFGKSVRHNLELIARLESFARHGRPIVIGVSRKSFLGKLGPGEAGGGDAPRPERPVDQRLEGGLAATAVAAFLGARVVRTHDVEATRRSLAVADALRAARGAGIADGART